MPETTRFTGPRGDAVQLKIDPKHVGSTTTVTWWLLTGPWHPLWPQFVLMVLRLADVPGMPPAKLHFPDATHELAVVALNPGDHPGNAAVKHSAETLEQGGFKAVGGFLEPVDVAHQFTATDDEMTQLAALCAEACVNGFLTPSTDDARSMYREQWLTACVKTLAHMRGEEHAP